MNPNPPPDFDSPLFTTWHREAVAYHEAGHAVVALRLGLPVNEVEVSMTVERNGRVCSGWADPLYMCKSDPSCWSRWATMLMAGPLAKRGFCLGNLDLPSRVLGVRVWGGRQDRLELLELARLLGVRPDIAHFQRQAALMLSDNWDHVVAMAAELVALPFGEWLSIWYRGRAATSLADAMTRQMLPDATVIPTPWHSLTPAKIAG